MLFWLAVGGVGWAQCDASDLELPGNDCDEDGVTVGEGDCDDADDTVFPGNLELCSDQVDNDCDGLLDEECEEEGLGSPQGGGLCGSGGAGDASAVLMLPLLWGRRRR